jgi:uroporphyrin-III C-methyltransferase
MALGGAAMPAWLQPETNEAVTFITGHSTSGEIPDRIDWGALAKGSPVIVLYMALKHLDLIRERLLSAGRSADEPLAVVSEAATPRQRVVVTTLGQSTEAVRRSGLSPPAIVVLGEVVRLRAGLDWLGLAEGTSLDPDPLGIGRRSDAG